MGPRVYRVSTLVVWFLCSLSAVPTPAQTPSPQSFQLRAIQVKGQRRYTPADVARVSGLELGRPVSVADLNAAADRMASTGLFETVKYQYVTTARELTVTFEIAEPAWTVPVVFDNFIWLSDRELIEAVREDVPSFDGTSPALGGASELIRGALQKVLKARGIAGQVDFSPQLDLKTKAQQYVFSVKTPSPKLCAVAVDGASGVSERELVEALTATVGADYSRFYVTTASYGTLTDLYRQRGYWRAAFDAPTATVTNSPTCAGAAVTLHVTEGRKYAWERATWTGNTALSAANLDSMLDMKNGETADGSKISSALYRVATAYANRGYIKAATRYTPRLDDAAARATFEFTVEEGPQFHAGALELVGLSDADAATLKKKWQLKAGDVYDESYVMKFRNEHTLHVQRGSNQAPRPADIETRVDDQAHVVDVRFVFR